MVEVDGDLKDSNSKLMFEALTTVFAAESDGTENSFRIPFELDHRQNNKFTGREDILKELDTEITIKRSKVVVLYGTGGMGKTQIALEYVHTHHTEFTSVFWVDVTSEEIAILGFRVAAQRLIDHHANIVMEPNYSRIAQLLGMPGVVDEHGQVSIEKGATKHIIRTMKLCFNRRENQKWLLILDNIDDLKSFNIRDFMSTQGTIIMASRRPMCADLGKGMEMGEMLKEEAILLLIKSARLHADQLSLEESKTAEDIAERLGYFAPAPDQAGAYISAGQLSLEKYMKLYEEQFSSVFREKPESSIWSYRDQPVITTWEVSFQAIKSENREAAELLLLCSFLSNENILEEMLRRGQGLEENDFKLSNSLKLLFSYSLARRKVADSFYIHPLVHRWARERCSLEKRMENTGKAVMLVHKSFPDNEKELWEFQARIITHIRIAYKNIKSLKLDTIGWIRAGWIDSAVSVAEAHWRQGWLEEAEELEVSIIEVNERVLGKEHPDTLTSMSNLAWTYRSQGRWKEAEELGLQALEASERVLGKEHPDTLASICRLASTYHSQGRWKEAEELRLRIQTPKR